jgi:hypothetical protein
MVEYHAQTDPLRETPLDLPSANPEDLICPDDLDKPKKKAGKGKRRSSTESRKSYKNAKQKPLRSVHFADDSGKEPIKENADLNDGMIEQDKIENATDKGENIKMSIQSSLGDLSTVANIKLAASQRQIGIAIQDTGVNQDANEDRRSVQKQMGMAMQHLHAKQKAKAALLALQQQTGEMTQDRPASVQDMVENNSIADDRDQTDDSNMAV